MRGSNTIFLNGRAYDATTGQQIDTVAKGKMPHKPKMVNDFGPRRAPAHPAVNRPPTTSPHTVVHAKTLQRSETLNRMALKKPDLSHVQKSPTITRFAPHPSQLKPTNSTVTKTAAASMQPAPHKAAPAAMSAVQTKTKNQLLKDALIKKRISEAEIAKVEKKTKQHKNRIKALILRKPRLFGIATVALALLMLGGYITYLNLPNLSMKVAAAHAGFDATYPEYHPDGYSLNGAVAYQPGKSVTLNFVSNGNDNLKYSLVQRASAWDSQAVQDDYVSKVTSALPTTVVKNGLTIYIYGPDNNAAWVNGGILYTISGNSTLSQDQITNIAASM